MKVVKLSILIFFAFVLIGFLSIGALSDSAGDVNSLTNRKISHKNSKDRDDQGNEKAFILSSCDDEEEFVSPEAKSMSAPFAPVNSRLNGTEEVVIPKREDPARRDQIIILAPKQSPPRA